MKHSTRLPLLSLALALPLSACGGTEAGQVELRDPDTQEVIGVYDGEQQAYVFDDDTVKVWEIDTTFVGPADRNDGDESDPGEPLTQPRSAQDNDALGDDGSALDPTLSVSDEVCWEAVYGADGDAILCRGCCTASQCREVCTEQSNDAAETAMAEWRDLSTPEPRPPRR